MSATAQERNALLTEYRNLHQLWRQGGDAAQGLNAAETKAERDSARLQYFAKLPVVAMSRCPFCAELLQSPFDPWGLDGFWWQERELGAAAKPQGCPHFRLLTGALSLQGNAPQGGEHPAHPGPEVPYVVPEILSLPSVCAVIASCEMENGYVAYPIAYYSQQQVAADALSPTWRMTTCAFKTNNGQPAWSSRSAPWDFDLAPWIAQGKICWIEPGDEKSQLVKEGPCPYADLPGERLGQVIKKDRHRFVQPPSGDEGDPFSP